MDKYPDFIESTGYGTGEGLCGWNCYHSFSPFIPGVSVPTYTAEQLEEMNRQENTPKEYQGKQYTAYQATQRQRRLETQMRAERQKIHLLQVGGADEKDITSAKCRYRATSAEYARFSKAMDLPQQRERVKIDSLDDVRKTPAKVLGKPTSPDDLTSEQNNDIVKLSETSLTENTSQVIPVGEVKEDNPFGSKLIKNKHTYLDDLKMTNPKYNINSPEYRQNCQRCVCAYEMRRRGFDVTAKPKILDGTDIL